VNEEEIHKALEIIKQPITVNCVDYHYFDYENYDKLTQVYENCLWFIRNFEQINTTVERVQQQNHQLKDRIEKAIKYIDAICLEKDGYVGYGDGIEPEDLIQILKGEEND